MFARNVIRFARNRLYCTGGTIKAVKRNNREVFNKPRNQDVLTTLLSDRVLRTPEDWIQVRQEILSSQRHINANNIDAMMLGFYTTAQNYDMAFRYLDFLKTQSIKMNLATTGKYFKLFYARNCNENPTKEGEDDLISVYEETRKSYDILDPITLESIIEGLSITKYWKLCVQLLEEMRVSIIPTASAYSATISALFVNGEEESAWQLLKEMLANDRPPKNVCYISYMKYIGKISKTKKKLKSDLEKLFMFFQEHDVKCNEEFIKDLRKFLWEQKLVGKNTNISDRGECRMCNKHLKKFDLTESEFADLKKKIIDNVIIGKDVFNKSTPEELQNFKNFIAKNKKYDVVIDGLNVAYSAGTRHSPKVLLSLVASVVSHFKEQNKEILILGRQHMSTWPGFKYLIQQADVFLTNDVSSDDPYLLYCALNSRKNTIVVSRDLMRSHRFLLKQYQLKIAFNRWLSQRLYQLKYADNRGKAIFKVPQSFTVSAQKVDDFWHIPYEVEKILPNNLKEKEINWLCIQF